MTVTFAEKLSRIPHYEPGTSLDDAKARAETADAVKLASNESPFPPHPDVIEAITQAAADVNRYPDPRRVLLRRRDRGSSRDATPPGSPSPTAPARSCSPPPWRSASPATRSSTPGPRSRSIRYLPALSGAREIRVPLDGRLRPRPRRDARGGDRGDPAADRLQPEQPDRDPSAGSSGSASFVRERALTDDDHPRRGLHRVPDQR